MNHISWLILFAANFAMTIVAIEVSNPVWASVQGIVTGSCIWQLAALARTKGEKR